ncbi:MAG: LON peptidase substrate-binding domain-containing protein [Gammaproteobacteria bacterium]
MKTIPLFPLNTVLFPDGLLPLRIFETRYLDMVSECTRTDSGFGVCLIRKGKEAGEPEDCYKTGTYARIIDWGQGDDGLLEIIAKGEHRIRISDVHTRPNGLQEGKVARIEESEADLSATYQPFSDLLYEIANRNDLALAEDTEKFDDASWVSQRLAEILPFDLSIKQSLLEMDDALRRFDFMRMLLEKIDLDKMSVS